MRTLEQEGERPRVLELLRQHGWNATSFQILEPGFHYWFADTAGCVGYVDTGGSWVAGGAPVGDPQRLGELARLFREAAARQGKRARFFAVEERFRDAAPVRAIQIGDQPVWDPGDWEAITRASRSLREQLRRARAKQVAVRMLGPGEMADREGAARQAIDRLVARWLGSRKMAPMGFLVALHPFHFPEERRYFVAERAGELLGLLAAVPVYTRSGWFFEDLLRDPQAPNGTAELLIDYAMRAVAAEGSHYVTLGLAPLGGSINRWLTATRQWSSGFYDFNGVRAFKAKLRPQRWEPIYLAYPEGERGVVALYDALAAFARGGLLRFGLETLLRGPQVVVRLLAFLLIPWTAMLAWADGPRWFPAPWVHWGWVGFDCVLAVALFSLSVRWRQWLASLLAGAVSTDATLTLIEVLTFNLPQARRPLDWVVMALAVLAPTLAAVVLWGACARHAHET